MRGCTVPCAHKNVPIQVTARGVSGYVAVTLKAVITNTDVLVSTIIAQPKNKQISLFTND